jgi:hypothetical protein
MPKLKEQRASPCVLPVDKTSDLIASYKEICGMNIPMPKSGASKLPILGEKAWCNIQELLVESNVSTGRILSCRCNKYILGGFGMAKLLIQAISRLAIAVR